MKPCPICDDTGPWPDAAGRAAHIRSHHETTCPVCGATLNAGGLDAHLRYVHPPDEPGAEQPAAAPAPQPDEPAAPADVVDVPESLAEPAAEAPTSSSCPHCDASPFPTLKGYKAHVRSHVDVDCPECGKKVKANGLGPHLAKHRRTAGQPPAAPPVARDTEVLCDECGRTVKASGLGNHRAGHRRAAEREQQRDEVRRLAEAPPSRQATPATKVTAIDRRMARGLAGALTDLLPGGAPDLIDRLATFVAKHEPDPGRGRWVAVTATAGPWLCRTAGVGLVVDREHVPVIVVSLDDVYSHLRRDRAAS